MAVKFRDYYETLGVPRNAAPDDIRKAFRKLARKYHPDVADDKVAAEEKFKEINEAYEVLGDAEKRKKYDALGENWRHGGEFNPPGGSGGGFGGFGAGQGGGGYDFHFDGTGFSDFFENLFGASRSRGGGAGFGPGGRGGAAVRRDGGDIEAEILVSLEEVMHGSERTLSFRQPEGERTTRIRIPKGITEGQRIRCAGLGQPGMNGGKPGDLYLHVHLERHPFFRADEHDLYMELRLAPWEAVLGATVPVRNLHGGTVRIKVPPHTDSGTEFRLAGKGLPKGKSGTFGDLYAVADIVTPETISEDERKLWQALADGSSFEPRS